MNLYEKISDYQARIKELLALRPEKKKGEGVPYIAIVMLSHNEGERIAGARMFKNLGYAKATEENLMQSIEKNQKLLFVVDDAEHTALLKNIFGDTMLVVYIKVGLQKLRLDMPAKDKEVTENFNNLNRPDFISEYGIVVFENRYYETYDVLFEIREKAGYIGKFQLPEKLQREVLM